MLNDTKYMQTFYHQQSIQIRKQIRQMDMYFKDLYNKNPNNQTLKQEQNLRQDINFIVIGPNKSGKSSLLKSIFFALNSHLNIDLITSQLPYTLIKRYDIKKTKKYNIQGLTKMKQTDQKRTISAFQFQGKYSLVNNSGKQLTSEQKSSRIFQKYSNALQIIDNKIFGCFKVSTSTSLNPIFNSQKTTDKTQPNPLQSTTIRTVLIVLNILAKTQYEQISGMKFFITDVRQKGLKIMIILTHVDKLNKMKECDKLTLIEQKIQMLRKQLDIKDRDDFICIQNYHDFNPQQIFNHSCNTNAQSNSQSNPSKHPSSGVQTGNHNSTNSNNNRYQKATTNNNFIAQKGPQLIQPSFQKVKLRQSQATNHYYQGEHNNFVYKKVSQVKNQYHNNVSSYSNDNMFTLQIPLISRNTQNFINSSNQIGKDLQSLSNGSIMETKQQKYANYKSKKGNNQIIQNKNNNQFGNKNYSAHKSTVVQQKSQPSTIGKDAHYLSHHQTGPSRNSQVIKNNEQINYYALKLLIKIIKENQKYVSKQIKGRKMLKWFCG